MKKQITFLGIVLLLTFSLAAQVSTGNITGKVVDKSGEALPGVTVTLTGSLTGAVPFVTTAEGSFRFLSLAPAGDYSLKAELEGFKTTVRGNILIAGGSNVNLTLTLEQGSLSEEVTVTAATPVIDVKKTSIGIIVSQEMLQQLPSSRDPFSIMKMAPSTYTYTEDVGGSEGGQAVIPSARGGLTQNLYVMDGFVINLASNPSTIPTYFDFDTFDEMNITVGGADVTSQTGGVQLNMVTRRGGNKIALGGRFYLTDKSFQADNMSDALRKEGLQGTNRINVIRDYGFNASGPIIKDKFWAHVSYGTQDIRNITRFDQKSDTVLETVQGKLNLQIIPQNRLEIFGQGNRKLMWGASPSSTNPEGSDRTLVYPWGYPIIRIQDDHMFGDNMFLSLKFGHNNGGYGNPRSRDPDFKQLAIFDLREQREYGGGIRYFYNIPASKYSANLNYFNDKLFGISHEMKLGFEYTDAYDKTQYGYPGNLRVERNFIAPTADFTGDGYPDVPTDSKFYSLRLERGANNVSGARGLSAYFSDTLTFGRFNIILGFRYDQMTPRIAPSTVLAIDRANPATQSTLTEKTIDLLDGLLPSVQIPEVKAKAADGNQYYWKNFVPRFSLSYDVAGDGKTLVKLSYAQFANIMIVTEANRWRPGGYAGWMYYYWQDNGDGKADFKELYWYTRNNYKLYRAFDDNGNFLGDWKDGSDKFWGGYDYANPGKLDTTSYERIDADAGAPLTTEIIVSVEREIAANMGVQLNVSYRKSVDSRLTYKYFPATNTFIDQSYYISAGTIPDSIPGIGDTGEAKGKEWFYQNTQASAYSPYTWVKNNKDYYTDYWGLDIAFNKRLTNKWMLNTSFSYQWSAPHWGKAGVIDPNNQWALDGINNIPKWTFKVAGLYQLPFDINVSANLSAREGRPIDRQVTYTDYRLPNPRSNSATLYLAPYFTDSLPAMINMSLRLEKMFRIADIGRMYFMVDVFNALNSTVAEARDSKLYGSYYVYPNSAQNRFVANINYNRLTKILNPRVARLGFRFEF
jgi:hypothetical protein